MCEKKDSAVQLERSARRSSFVAVGGYGVRVYLRSTFAVVTVPSA